MRRLIESVAPVWQMWCLAYYRAALRQIDPLHPDVPEIVRRVNQLETARRSA